MRQLHVIGLAIVAAVVMTGCATKTIKPEHCPAGTQKLEGCPPLGAVDDPVIRQLHASRTLVSSQEIGYDPVEIGRHARIPVNRVRAKFIGSTNEESLQSLAAKLYLIEHAEHSIDVGYYIYRDDLTGLAILGALCNAVKRGVDVRVLVDSIGSFSLDKDFLRALVSCADDAGLMKTVDGRETIHKARVQATVFNAVSKIFVNHNRRSHDKLFIVDGEFADKSAVITGGRNIANVYYGISEDGTFNPDTYRDAEIFLRGGDAVGESDDCVGDVSEYYFTLLFQFANNQPLRVSRFSNPARAYARERTLMQESLETMRALPLLSAQLAGMDEYVSGGFHDADVQLAHELSNLTDTNVVRDAVRNSELNPNSVMNILNAVLDDAFESIQLVSPYMFAALYHDRDGNVLLDEAKELHEWLDAHPDRSITLIVNTVLTSDNYFTQAVTDMDLAPRLLLSDELRDRWLAKPAESELNPALVESAEWRDAIAHPRLEIWATGTLQDSAFGGDHVVGKPHGKYMATDDHGFVGTTNFDYRSRLFNNEMGYFFNSAELAADLRRNTDFLIRYSYPWGSPEWLELRKRVGEMSGLKGTTTRSQRTVYRTLRSTGLKWQF